MSNERLLVQGGQRVEMEEGMYCRQSFNDGEKKHSYLF